MTQPELIEREFTVRTVTGEVRRVTPAELVQSIRLYASVFTLEELNTLRDAVDRARLRKSAFMANQGRRTTDDDPVDEDPIDPVSTLR